MKNCSKSKHLSIFINSSLGSLVPIMKIYFENESSRYLQRSSKRKRYIVELRKPSRTLIFEKLFVNEAEHFIEK